MAAHKLGVIQGGKSAESDADVPLKPSEVVGSKPWADKLRKRAKEIVHTIDFGYTELAQILYELGYVRIDKDEKNSTFWASWNFKSFVDWAQRDLGLHKRKAQHLSHVHWSIEVDLKNQGAPDELRARLRALPFSKLRLMPRIVDLKLDLQKIEKWTDYAETTTYVNLEAAVAKYVTDHKLKGSQASIADAVAHGATAGDLIPDSNVEADDADVASSFVDDEDTSPEVLAGNAPPAMQKTIPLQFAAYAAQHEIIESALKHAGSVSGSEVRTQNLTLICMDYLNGVAPVQDKDAKLSYVATMEKLLGLKLIVVHPTTGELLYGQDALELLAASAAAS